MATHRQAPGPMEHRLLGHGGDLTRNPLEFFLRLGANAAMWSGSASLTCPDSVEEVLVSEQRKFGKVQNYRRSFSFLGNGLLTSEGDLWLRQRRMMLPAFHSSAPGTPS